MEHTPIIKKEAYRNRINVTYICKDNKEVKELVTACNKHERLVECLNDMYRLVESHKECWTEETESDGVTPTMFAENRIREIEKAKQLLSEIEGGK